MQLYKAIKMMFKKAIKQAVQKRSLMKNLLKGHVKKGLGSTLKIPTQRMGRH